MRKLILPLLFAVPTLAMAASVREYSFEDHKPTRSIDGDKLAVQEGAVTLSGSTDLELIDCGTSHCVEVTMGEETKVMSLHLGYGVKLPDAVFGDEPRTRSFKNAGGSVATQEVEFTAGDASFEVLAQNGYAGSNDGSIGLLTFPDVAVALLPSQGVARLAPAGSGLAVEGPTVEYTHVGSKTIKEGGKRYIAPQGIVFDGTVNGEAARVRLSSKGTVIARDKVPEGSVTGNDHVRVTVGIGDASIEALAAESYSTDFSHADWDLSLGSDVVSRWDLAWDPASSTLAFTEAGEVVRRVQEDESGVESALEALNPPVDTTEPGATTALEGAALAGAHTGVAAAYAADGDLEKALEHALQAADADPTGCGTHHSVGSYLVDLDRLDDAIPHFEKSGELYAAWADLPYRERAALTEEKAEIEEDGGTWEGPIIQPHSCHTAWGNAAKANLSLGNYEAVTALYDEHHDLDADLAQAAGLAWMAQGRYGKAESAWRQYARLVGPRNAQVQQGLGVLNTQKGQPQLALTNFEAGFDSADVSTMLAWANAAAEDHEVEDVLAQMDERIVATADQGHLLLAKALFQAGHELDNAETLAAAVVAYEDALVLLSEQRGDLWSGLAYARVLAGDEAGASEAADKAVDLASGNAQLWMAYAAQAEMAAGDEAKVLSRKAKLESGSATLWAL